MDWKKYRISTFIWVVGKNIFIQASPIEQQATPRFGKLLGTTLKLPNLFLLDRWQWVNQYNFSTFSQNFPKSQILYPQTFPPLKYHPVHDVGLSSNQRFDKSSGPFTKMKYMPNK